MLEVRGPSPTPPPLPGSAWGLHFTELRFLLLPHYGGIEAQNTWGGGLFGLPVWFWASISWASVLLRGLNQVFLKAQFLILVLPLIGTLARPHVLIQK